MTSQIKIINGLEYELSAQGYLISYSQWNHDFVIATSKEHDIELTEHHWIVINKARDFFESFNQPPGMRLLVKHLKDQYGPEIGNSIYLQQLFPQGPAKIVALLAGLPKSAICL